MHIKAKVEYQFKGLNFTLTTYFIQIHFSIHFSGSVMKKLFILNQFKILIREYPKEPSNNIIDENYNYCALHQLTQKTG